MSTNGSNLTNLDAIRDRIANSVLIALSFIVPPALIASLMRIPSIGWQPVMVFHIVAAIILICATLFRNSITYNVRGIIIVGIIFLVGIGGLLNFALNGAGVPGLMASCIFAAVLFGTRGGLVVLLLGFLSIAVIGMAYSSEAITLHFDSNIYNVQLRSWLTTLLGFALFSGGAVATVIGLNKALMGIIRANEDNLSQLGIQVKERSRSLTDEIREREKAEQNFHLSEERYHKIIDAQTELITTFTPDGTFTFVSDSYCRYAGKRKEDLLGRSLYEPVPEAEVESLKEYFTSFSRQHPNKTNENQLLSGEGDLRYYEWSNSATFDENDEIIEIQSVGRDVTERKEVEILKSEFISLVSHELRTPLTSIMGSISLIEGGALGKVPEKMTDLLAIAKGNSERLISIVNDILDFEKLQSGGMDFNFREIDLVELVEKAVTLNHGYADQCGVRFVMAETTEEFIVKADSERLEQVVSNLLSNAAKFSAKGSDVHVSVHNRDGQARVEVSDTGIGISEKFKDTIFDRFSQADTGDKRAVKGTGLGLSISRAIIECHDGNIDFDSCVGEATTFHFTLPIVVSTDHENGNQTHET